MHSFFALVALTLATLVSTMASETPASNRANLVLGGGCFWCVEAAYADVPGVIDVVSGYAAGTVEQPTYEQICEGDTDHAEVIAITYDPATVSLDRLFDLFFRVHDPTTRNRQGHDNGTQYRSVILVQNALQRTAALAAISRNQARFQAPIVTVVADLAGTGPGRFWIAEAYHQDYFKKNPTQGYCLATIPPKLDKVRKFLAESKP